MIIRLTLCSIDQFLKNLLFFYTRCKGVKKHEIDLAHNCFTAIALEQFIPPMRQTLREICECLRENEREMIGSKAMRRKNNDLINNCSLRLNNFDFTEVRGLVLQSFTFWKHCRLYYKHSSNVDQFWFTIIFSMIEKICQFNLIILIYTVIWSKLSWIC